MGYGGNDSMAVRGRGVAYRPHYWAVFARDVVLGIHTCTRVQLEYKFEVLVVVVVLVLRVLVLVVEVLVYYATLLIGSVL